jgi:hypothetical protein
MSFAVAELVNEIKNIFLILLVSITPTLDKALPILSLILLMMVLLKTNGVGRLIGI